MNLPPLCWDLEPTSKSESFGVERQGGEGAQRLITKTATVTTRLLLFRALGMGGTRGRIYIKHPHLFKVGVCWALDHCSGVDGTEKFGQILIWESGHLNSSCLSAFDLNLL